MTLMEKTVSTGNPGTEHNNNNHFYYFNMNGIYIWKKFIHNSVMSG